MTTATATAFGSLLRDWRQRRRLTQLDLGLAADVSARHLSFLETGRWRPGREMVLHLAEELDVPLRGRNEMMTAAGYAAAYSRHGIDDDELADPSLLEPPVVSPAPHRAHRSPTSASFRS